MTVTIRNEGTADTAVILGNGLGDSSKYLVDDMTMQVTTGSGRPVVQYQDLSATLSKRHCWSRGRLGPSHFRPAHRIRFPSPLRISSLVRRTTDAIPCARCAALPAAANQGPTEAPNLDVTAATLSSVDRQRNAHVERDCSQNAVDEALGREVRGDIFAMRARPVR